jgi:Ca2+:H+ antiporter
LRLSICPLCGTLYLKATSEFSATQLPTSPITLSTILITFVVYDGKSIWLEGIALISLYCMIAASFWWG